jgi:hypothetical protein
MRRIVVQVATAMLLTAGLLAPGASDADAASLGTLGGVVRGRSWQLYDYDFRYDSFEPGGVEYQVTLVGVFRIGAKSWTGAIPLHFRRGHHMHHAGPDLAGSAFRVTNLLGHTIVGHCTPQNTVPRTPLLCHASIDGSAAGKALLRIALNPRSAADPTRTYDPRSRWYRSQAQPALGVFSLA